MSGIFRKVQGWVIYLSGLSKFWSEEKELAF